MPGRSDANRPSDVERLGLGGDAVRGSSSAAAAGPDVPGWGYADGSADLGRLGLGRPGLPAAAAELPEWTGARCGADVGRQRLGWAAVLDAEHPAPACPNMPERPDSSRVAELEWLGLGRVAMRDAAAAGSDVPEWSDANCDADMERLFVGGPAVPAPSSDVPERPNADHGTGLEWLFVGGSAVRGRSAAAADVPERSNADGCADVGRLCMGGTAMCADADPNASGSPRHD